MSPGRNSISSRISGLAARASSASNAASCSGVTRGTSSSNVAMTPSRRLVPTIIADVADPAGVRAIDWIAGFVIVAVTGALVAPDFGSTTVIAVVPVVVGLASSWPG